MSRLSIILEAFFQLGWRKSLRFARYQLLLKLGVYTFLTPTQQSAPLKDTTLSIPFNLPEQDTLENALKENLAVLIAQADAIVAGKIQPFGLDEYPLNLNPGMSLQHWTKHKGSQHNHQDIKFTWEPARFGWATTLARAYYLTAGEKYTKAFWRNYETFQSANPVNQGPNWASAQEVGLRLMHWVYCYAIFQHSPQTSEAQKQAFALSIAQHAQRIPPTLLYARAQNNNHLLSEAAALYTAAIVLPHHPQSKKWRALGWQWFNWGIQHQIADDGLYMQHSTNYHRLVLQLALWMNLLIETQPESFPPATQAKLSAATQWLANLLDPTSRRVPNLGPNDGAYIFPLTTQPFTNYHPVIQAAKLAFTDHETPQPDELSLWLTPKNQTSTIVSNTRETAPSKLTHPEGHSWATLRTPTFTDRPGHADLLHLDLWWRGTNITLDPGTYQYNAAPPWENALQGTDVHNTIMINGEHQMKKASRFLWLNWPKMDILHPKDAPSYLAAQHNGYKKMGISHHRRVETDQNQWLITDTLTSKKTEQQPLIRLHWLLPDSDYTLDGTTLTLNTPSGTVTLAIAGDTSVSLALACAGKLLHGQGTIEPHRGWYSPTYAHKIPALSLTVETQAPLPITLNTTFTLTSP